jgi:hypothetical protein
LNFTSGNNNQILKNCNGTPTWLDIWDKCPPPPVGSVTIGSNYGGGIVFYVDTLTGHGLVCAPNDVGIFPFGCGGQLIGTVPHLGGGLQNTLDILRKCNERPIAASICDTFIHNGYSDWFLPSRDELELMLQNLHLQGLGNFSNNLYLSSSEFDGGYAYYAGLWYTNRYIISVVGFNGPGKGHGRVRPIRAF